MATCRASIADTLSYTTACGIYSILMVLGLFASTSDEASVVPMNNTFFVAVPKIPPDKSRNNIIAKERERALILICGIILGIPLGALTACGIREFICAVWERYRLEALRKNYMYKMSLMVAQTQTR